MGATFGYHNRISDKYPELQAMRIELKTFQIILGLKFKSIALTYILFMASKEQISLLNIWNKHYGTTYILLNIWITKMYCSWRLIIYRQKYNKFPFSPFLYICFLWLPKNERDRILWERKKKYIYIL